MRTCLGNADDPFFFPQRSIYLLGVHEIAGGDDDAPDIDVEARESDLDNNRDYKAKEQSTLAAIDDQVAKIQKSPLPAAKKESFTQWTEEMKADLKNSHAKDLDQALKTVNDQLKALDNTLTKAIDKNRENSRKISEAKALVKSWIDELAYPKSSNNASNPFRAVLIEIGGNQNMTIHELTEAFNKPDLALDGALLELAGQGTPTESIARAIASSLIGYVRLPETSSSAVNPNETRADREARIKNERLVAPNRTTLTFEEAVSPPMFDDKRTNGMGSLTVKSEYANVGWRLIDPNDHKKGVIKDTPAGTPAAAPAPAPAPAPVARPQAAPETSETAEKPTQYRVLDRSEVEGKFLKDIAAEHNMTEADLIALNQQESKNFHVSNRNGSANYCYATDTVYVPVTSAEITPTAPADEPVDVSAEPASTIDTPAAAETPAEPTPATTETARETGEVPATTLKADIIKKIDLTLPQFAGQIQPENLKVFLLNPVDGVPQEARVEFRAVLNGVPVAFGGRGFASDAEYGGKPALAAARYVVNNLLPEYNKVAAPGLREAAQAETEEVGDRADAHKADVVKNINARYPDHTIQIRPEDIHIYVSNRVEGRPQNARVHLQCTVDGVPVALKATGSASDMIDSHDPVHAASRAVILGLLPEYKRVKALGKKEDRKKDRKEDRKEAREARRAERKADKEAPASAEAGTSAPEPAPAPPSESTPSESAYKLTLPPVEPPRLEGVNRDL